MSTAEQTLTAPTNALAAEIATALDELDRPGWTVAEGHWDGSAYLVGPDGVQFFLRDHRAGSYVRANERGKVEIHPSLPNELNDHAPYRGYGVKRPEMMAAADRGARAIARDLVRKLLETAREELGQARARKAESEAADAWELVTMGQVAEALGVPAPTAPPEDDWHRKDWRPKLYATPRTDESRPGYCRVEAEASRYSRTVTLNVQDVSPTVALRIAAVLAEADAWRTR